MFAAAVRRLRTTGCSAVLEPICQVHTRLWGIYKRACFTPNNSLVPELLFGAPSCGLGGAFGEKKAIRKVKWLALAMVYMSPPIPPSAAASTRLLATSFNGNTHLRGWG